MFITIYQALCSVVECVFRWLLYIWLLSVLVCITVLVSKTLTIHHIYILLLHLYTVNTLISTCIHGKSVWTLKRELVKTGLNYVRVLKISPGLKFFRSYIKRQLHYCIFGLWSCYLLYLCVLHWYCTYLSVIQNRRHHQSNLGLMTTVEFYRMYNLNSCYLSYLTTLLLKLYNETI